MRATRLICLTMFAIAVAAIVGCGTSASPLPVPDGLAVGTWGGDSAGVIVGDTSVHVHVGCTFGDFHAPVALDASGRFAVAGSYMLRAYPIQVGPTVPARFTGQIRGAELTLTVAVDDTVEKRSVTRGPVTVTFGKEPRMGPCPICRNPPGIARRRAASTASARRGR